MIINTVEIKNLYGYMNKSIVFNNDINLLVGINGSGKTSVLNIINWLLVPSIPNLCTTEFDKIEINFTFKKEIFLIRAIQNEKELIITLKNISRDDEFQPIRTEFRIHPKKITKNSELKEDYFNSYDLEPEKSEELTWHFLNNKISNPIVIGLDRNIYTEEGDEVNYFDDNLMLRRHGRSNENPLEKVMTLSGHEYVRYKNKILDLNKKLNNKIMLSSFDETLTLESIDEIMMSPRISFKQVESLEVKVKDYFKENIIIHRRSSPYNVAHQEESFTKIEQYFTNLKNILKEANNDKKEAFNILYITNLNQFKKIKELIREFEEFENKGKKFFEPIKQYLETINGFLRDSAKQLYFDKNSSKLKFRIIKDNLVIEENREIDNLSSGEKQILMLFTYIKFNSRYGKLFIIDEPELSLHPKWQEYFLEAIKKILPANTQVLFATHSPAIVGTNKSYCTVLTPY